MKILGFEAMSLKPQVIVSRRHSMIENSQFDCSSINLQRVIIHFYCQLCLCLCHKTGIAI